MFKDGLYFEIGKQANNMALYAKEQLIKLGYQFYYDSPSNQQFVIYPKDKFLKLSQEVVLEKWFDLDEDNLVFRFVTTYKTTKEEIDYFINLLKTI